MAKKTKSPKNASRNVTSVSELRATRAVDAITPAFVDWCRQTEDVPAEDALVLLGPVKVLVAAYFHASPSSEPTSFEPIPFGLAMEAALSEHDDEEDWRGFAFDAIHVYIEFLGKTDAWTGTDEDFNAVDELFHMGEEGVLPDVVAPNLTPEEVLAGLEGTELCPVWSRGRCWTTPRRLPPPWVWPPRVQCPMPSGIRRLSLAVTVRPRNPSPR